MIEGLTQEQRELEEKFKVKFKINERGKLYLEVNKKYEDFIKEEKLKEINNEYDRKVQEYFSEYPKEMIKYFSTKEEKAKKILSGKEDIFIKKLAEKKGVTKEVYASSILDKVNETENFLLQCELDRMDRMDKINNI